MLLNSDDVTVCIPSIPIRQWHLGRAIASVCRQTHPAQSLAVWVDHNHSGAWVSRSKTLDMAQTTWVAFLDDDDEMLPQHLQRCLEVQIDTGADVIVPWYDVIGGADPVPGHRDLQINPEALHSFAITCLIRREVIGDIRFKDRFETGAPEDWIFWHDLVEAGAKFHQIPETTWLWHHDSGNTSGRPDRW